MATRTESPEFQTVRGKFAVICGSISAPDVVNFAGELLQSNLISDAGRSPGVALKPEPDRTADHGLDRKRTTENGRGLALKSPKTKPNTLKPSPLTVQSREGILTRAFGPW